MINIELINTISLYWILFALILFPFLFFVKQPYGRHIRKGWGITLPNRTGWILMELPSLTIIGIILVFLPSRAFFSSFLALLWIIHYVHRTLVFPFRIKTKGKKMPVVIVISGLFFNLVNATINGQSLLYADKHGLFSNKDLIRLGFGLFLFVSGMFINLYSDYSLIKLRKSSTNGYQIPQKFLFKWISCPNYFGEIIEWSGFAIMAWNPAAFSFAVWTMVNLIPRAVDHHKWYMQKFAEYPKTRKAIIPYVL